MLIPEHKIEEILERTDLVALISRHVELKKAGRSYKGRCPFHQEKSPSFHVTPEMKRFKCFGCQAGGDAISFVQRYLGKTFVDAVRDLAREAGVDLEGAVDPTAKERQQLRDATDLAQEHFKSRLWDSEKGRKARAYLQSRGLTDELIRQFGLGWSPLEWTDLAARLQSSGVIEFGVKAGLVQPRRSGDGFFDVFRGRVMIPIRSPEGRTIAFGGRLLEGEDGPKYLNSKESKLYNKSEILYGIDVARDEIRKKKAAVLVEGYFDCIAMHQAGVRNAVALCSTALTPGHLALLARTEAKELVLLLDGDEAGRKAVERLAGVLIAGGTATRVALLPQGEDPDTFARKAGDAGVQKLIAEARGLTQHLFATILPDGAAASFEEKMKALDRVKPIAAQLEVGLVRSAFFSAMGTHFGIPASELESSLRGKAPQVKAVPKPFAPPGAPNAARPAAPQRMERAPDALEATYAAMLLRKPELARTDAYRVSDELAHTGLRTLVARVATGGSAQDALYEASEGVRRALESAQRNVPTEEIALEVAFSSLCRSLKLKRVREQLDFIARETAKVMGANDLTPETRALIEQRVSLVALRTRLEQEMKAGTKP